MFISTIIYFNYTLHSFKRQIHETNLCCIYSVAKKSSRFVLILDHATTGTITKNVHPFKPVIDFEHIFVGFPIAQPVKVRGTPVRLRR